jgi:hypothetical protein
MLVRGWATVMQAFESPDVDDAADVYAHCQLRCRLRRHAAADHVDWAGLPINLDSAFSREQRDKVYAQHLMRTRDIQPSRWWSDGAPPCACDAAAELARQADESQRLRGAGCP